jgi:predicted porin
MAAPSEGIPGNRYLGGRVGYRRDPFDVSAAYGTTRSATGADFKQWNVAGQWDFGVAKLQALYNQHSYGALRQRTTGIGARIPAGTGEILALLGMNNRSGGAPGSGFGDADDSRLISAGYYYYVSKRTTLYAIAGRISNEGAAKLSVAYTTPAAMRGGENSNGEQVGISHRF